MSTTPILEAYIFVLALFVGFQLISKVPSILHTPLMSGTNAIHGVVLVGAIVLAAGAKGALGLTLGAIAVLLATMNVVGGFVVTDRILEMFKARPDAGAPRSGAMAGLLARHRSNGHEEAPAGIAAGKERPS